MTLLLSYRVNEGIRVSEDKGNGHRESVEVIVRDIVLFPEGVNVDFELRGLNRNSKLSLCEDEKYDVTHLCTLHLPRNPLKRRSLLIEDTVSLKFYAPREVKFGERKMYY